MNKQEGKRPKVLYLINGFKRGGAERGVLHLAQSGAFCGSEVTVLSIIADQGAHVESLREHGLRIGSLWATKKMSFWQWVLAIPCFAWKIAKCQPDLLILSLPQANIAGRIAAIPFPKLKVASFEHNTHLAKPIYERLFRLTSGRVNWLIADCEATAKEVSERLYVRPPERQIVLPLVSFDLAIIPTQGSSSNSIFTVANAARFTDVKNQRALILALKILRDRGRNVRLVLYGEGANLADCKALAQSLEVSSHVAFPGFDPSWADHPADLFCIVSEHEGLCIVALEAMSRGIPVLSTPVGGIKEYGLEAKVEFTGFSDPDEIADAIDRLIGDRKKLSEMALSGRRMVGRLFSHENVARRCAEFSKEIASLA